MRILLRGGLGNQLFQVLMGLEIERRFGEKVLFSDLMLRDGLISDHTLKWPNYTRALGLAQKEMGKYSGAALRLLASVVNRLEFEEKSLFGLLSSRHEMNLQPAKCQARWLDTPGSSSEIDEVDVRSLRTFILDNFPSIESPPTDFFALHLRLGDFEVLSDTYGELMSVYLPGVGKYLDSLSGSFTRVILFSDEPLRAKEALRGSYHGEVDLASSFCSTTEEEFRLMMDAKAIAISNSTFSWWAARLGSAVSVLYPEPFRGPQLRLPQYRIPTGWIGVNS
jgi:hypothetical protein